MTTSSSSIRSPRPASMPWRPCVYGFSPPDELMHSAPAGDTMEVVPHRRTFAQLFEAVRAPLRPLFSKLKAFASRAFARLADELEVNTARSLPSQTVNAVANVVATGPDATRQACIDLHSLYQRAGRDDDEPARDALFQQTIRSELAARGGVDMDALDSAPVPDEIPVRFDFLRKAAALQTVVADESLSEPLRAMALSRLAKVGGDDALEMLAKVEASASPGLAKLAKKAAQEIQKSKRLDIVLTAWEVKPYAGSGGLSNVMMELSRALAKMGHRVTVISPLHEQIDRNAFALRETGKVGMVMGPGGSERFNLLKDRQDGVDFVFIENDRYFSKNRPGLYAHGNKPYADTIERYDFFGAAVPVALRALKKTAPDIVQANDHHTATVLKYLKEEERVSFSKTRRVMAIHNHGHAYQGRYGADDLCKTRIDGLGDFREGDLSSLIEFHGDLSFLKAGALSAHVTTMVSRKQKSESLEPAGGAGMHGIFQWLDLRGRLFGNMNGIDNKKFDPSRPDPALPATFSIQDLAGKAACKADLQQWLGLAKKPNTPIIAVCTRMDIEQKAVDEILARAERAVANNEDVQFAVLGEGNPELMRAFAELWLQRPDMISYDARFSLEKERRILAGSDFFYMPSRREPCGTPQLYSLRYLTLPTVRPVGGLDESIEDFDPETGQGNGFKRANPDHAVEAALALYRKGPDAMRPVLENAAASNFDWQNASAPEQLAIYRTAMDDTNLESDIGCFRSLGLPVPTLDLA